jgi:hypothetical protein
MMIQETKRRPGQRLPFFPGYITIDKPRNTDKMEYANGGGVMSLIAEGIGFINDVTQQGMEDIQTIRITRQTGGHAIILNTYISPTHHIRQEAHRRLDEELHAISEKYECIDRILVGDLNDGNGQLSKTVLAGRGLTRIGQGKGPTHTGGKELDQCWLSRPENCEFQIIGTNCRSDHFPILITVKDLGPIRKKANITFDIKMAR